ncbi:hypothetical protein WUBG_15978 [Wuchereria bancrofti]|uniref:Uncharacterized protein n=1 Tax=Wuchereria bancrofti TaxID=6293 RepID=J9AGA8_WUCBA|nr:hypothetical protein WUBG_15978 [Wuchereria bancrofti]
MAFGSVHRKRRLKSELTWCETSAGFSGNPHGSTKTRCLTRSGYSSAKDAAKNAYVDVQVINGAGHYVYVDQKDVFNNVVSDLFDKIDANEDIFLRKNVEKESDSE